MTTSLKNKKKDGFQGQLAIVIPKKILKTQCEKNPIAAPLYITDIGYYPKASHHFRDRPHGSDQHILIYCVEGKGDVRIQKKKLEINAGNFFIVPRNTTHRYEANETDPWTIYWIHFKGSVSDALVELSHKQHNGPAGFVNFKDSRNDLFLNMYRQLERGYELENLVYINMNLWHYLTSFVFLDKYNTTAKANQEDQIDKAISFMGEKINRVITLEEMALEVNLSPSHFSALFKKKTGFSPIEYFNHLKVQKACQYLLFSNSRIKEIAFQLGIEDPYYFSRLFRKVMSMSPIEYRHKLAREQNLEE